jgi:hypothetical protein
LYKEERINVPPQGKISYLENFCNPDPESEIFDLLTDQYRLPMDDTMARYMIKQIKMERYLKIDRYHELMKQSLLNENFTAECYPLKVEVAPDDEGEPKESQEDK